MRMELYLPLEICQFHQPGYGFVHCKSPSGYGVMSSLDSDFGKVTIRFNLKGWDGNDDEDDDDDDDEDDHGDCTGEKKK